MAPTQERLTKLHDIAAHRQRDLILVLEDIHDPHNASAIFRSADALGVQEIYLIFEKTEPWNPRELGQKTSGFTNKWLNFHTFTSTQGALDQLRQNHYQIYATILDENAEPLYHADFTKEEPIALVVGNEHTGISDTMKKNTDRPLYLPMHGFAQSLNVSVATALFLGEMVRQRNVSPTDFYLGKSDQEELITNFLQHDEASKEIKRQRKIAAKTKAKS